MLTYLLLITLIQYSSFCSYAQNETAQTVTDSTSSGDDNTVIDSLKYSHPTYIYDTHGKDDPFRAIITDQADEEEEENRIKDLFSYEGATILGIVNSGTDSYALVNDEYGSSYVLRVGDRVLGGTVQEIAEDAIVFDIVKYARDMTIIMRLESSKYTVYEEIAGKKQIRRPGINITYKKSSSGVSIQEMDEEVTVPSLDVQFIEDEWFGSAGSGINVNELTDRDTAAEKTGQRIIIPMLTPHNNEWITLPYAFEWLNSENLDCVYAIVIYDDKDMNNPVFIARDIDTTSYLLQDTVELPVNRQLFWEVIARDNAGNQRLNRQTIMSFKIKGQ